MKTSNSSKKEGAASRDKPPGGLRSGTCLHAGEDPFDEVLWASFDEVYWRHKSFILQEIRRRLRSRTSRSLLDDIFQEVCAKLDLLLGGTPGAVPNPSRELLLDLVSNQVRSQTRSEARRRVSGEPDDDTPPSSRSNPELLYIRAEDTLRRRELFNAVLTELEPAARAALTLVDVDDLSNEDAAAKMGCSKKTLALRLHRARQKFGEVGRELEPLLRKRWRRR